MNKTFMLPQWGCDKVDEDDDDKDYQEENEKHTNEEDNDSDSDNEDDEEEKTMSPTLLPVWFCRNQQKIQVTKKMTRPGLHQINQWQYTYFLKMPW